VDPKSAQPNPDIRHNSIAYAVDYASFNLGMTFVNISSVFPALVGQLTDSAPIIGLIGTVWRGCWLLPQLPVGQWINRQPRKKRFMMLSASIGRIPFWIVAAALWLGLAKNPTVLLILLFSAFGILAAGDGLATLAWFDIMARALPAKVRSRVISLAQLFGGILGVGTGLLVSLILSSSKLPFPTNYGLLFTLASLFIGVSTVALSRIREPEPSFQKSTAGAHHQTNLWALVRGDRHLVYFIVCRILVGLAELSLPFYVGHAQDTLHLPTGIIGAFVIAQTLGGVAASALLGVAGAHRGPRYVIRVGSAISALGPIFALAAHLSGASWLGKAYPFVFITLGVANNVRFIGFFNYLLEIAPEEIRPTYVGLSNTILGLLTLAPTMGGWLLESTSYSTLFGATAIFALVGFTLTLGLKLPADIRRSLTNKDSRSFGRARQIED